MKNERKSPANLFSKCMSFLLAAVLAAGGSGCKTYDKYSPTYNLWNQDHQPSFCRPDADPELALYDVAAGRDLLVIYNCGSERHPGSHRRAYFQEVNRAHIATNLPPLFASPKLARGLTPIFVIKEYSFQADPAPTNTWARVQKDSFTLHRAGLPPEICKLPYYQDYFPLPISATGKFWRTALTPVTVSGEVIAGVVVAGVVIGAYTAELWGPMLAN
jgi:hypothetical protein